jgi:peptidyl-prolyl cis-trans isomerase SurA
MKGLIYMKRKAGLLLLLPFACCSLLEAQEMADSVIMTVGTKTVPVDEFVYMARKNNEVNLSDAASVQRYINLFANFKRKVADAEARGFDKRPAFDTEYTEYRNQLINGYLSDPKGEEVAAKAIYDRGGEYLVVSHIQIPYKKEQNVTADTVPLYAKAMEIYGMLQKGEDFDSLGMRLARPFMSSTGLTPQEGSIEVRYLYIRRLSPLQESREFENVAYSTPKGSYSRPIRMSDGYHIIKVVDRRPFFLRLQASYINMPYNLHTGVHRSKQEVQRIANEALKKARAGEDFSKLVYTYSADTVGAGLLPPFGPTEMQYPLEQAVFNLKAAGDISEPVFTDKGAYIFKLENKQVRLPFDEVKDALISKMAETDRLSDLKKTYDDHLKAKYKFRFFPQAYKPFVSLCDNYFPLAIAFWEKTKDLDKPLFNLDGLDYMQSDFARYIREKPISAEAYSKDFLNEILELCVREIGTAYERVNLNKEHPEIPFILQEYRDGMLLFEISNSRIWSKPEAEQAALDEAWTKELETKYPLKINQQALRKILNQTR